MGATSIPILRTSLAGKSTLESVTIDSAWVISIPPVQDCHANNVRSCGLSSQGYQAWGCLAAQGRRLDEATVSR
jgi:hypothetical protein